MPSSHPAGQPVATALGLLVVAASLAGCASHSPHRSQSVAAPTVARTSGPDPLAAQAAAVQEFGLLAGGGWAQAWNLWTPDAQRAISQADFVRLNTQCHTSLGVPYQVQNVTSDTATTVRVTWQRAGQTGHGALSYLNGTWRYEPDPQTLDLYRRGVPAALTELRKEKACQH